MTELEQRIAYCLGDLTQFQGHSRVELTVHLADRTSWDVVITRLDGDTWELTDYTQRR